MLQKVIPYAHQLLKEAIYSGDTVIDGTCGNGYDTLFLSNLVGESGTVYAIDIQQAAIENTTSLLKKHQISNTVLLLEDHQYIKRHIPEEASGTIGAAIFNLGYLPGSDKQTITTPESTISAIEAITEILRPGGVIAIVVYYGHKGGEIEKDALLNYAGSLDQKTFHVLKYEFINQKNDPPFLLAIEKRTQPKKTE
ncbi:tRNA (mnm(5)s(2)U34)-methyltransferase [Sediminibacillus albus]|uniref:Putative rRNA methylase n=1 Tax=Sediminibacillus albus TaxID=407036 RepID=A0A1G8Z2F2_9BACI|nr:class I SAM-dependent methyltransferase [Sediminibacillus albus]SDK09216.1 Putative rRNA methylase [Sediminibacillus albus]